MPVLDQPRIEPADLDPTTTVVAHNLYGTLTAKAPTNTPIPTDTPVPPTPIPSPTPTRAPFVSGEGPFIVFVREMQADTENIILKSSGNTESVLTRFGSGRTIDDLAWSADGQWIIFLSAYNYLFSRNNERNAFAVRPDGTGLRMLTGEYLDPASVEGPFVTLSGTVTGAEGECLVNAQGSTSPITTTTTGSFELPGVPVSSKWIRAVCEQGTSVKQGDVSLALSASITNSIAITVSAMGQGFTSVSLSPDGCTLAGIAYQWSLNDQGERVLTTTARLMNLAGAQLAELPLPDGASISDLAWSPLGNQLVGTLNSGNSVSLWLWDSQGNSIGSLVEITDPEDTFYTVLNPSWSG
ncbi:MAG: TolB-like translocation protein, partial [Anaerolineae bacterium]